MPDTDSPGTHRHYRGALALGIAWVVLSPFMWWHNLRSQFGVELPLSLLAAPLALALAALCSAPFLWSRNRRAAGVLAATSLLVALLSLWFAPGFSGGTLLNAALLAVIAVAAWRGSPRTAKPGAEA